MTTPMSELRNADTDGAGTRPLSAASSSPVPDDPVTRLLRSRGLDIDTAYLGESEFELGKRVRLSSLDLIYRFEGGTLLICDITAIDASADPAGAMRALVSLVHAVERAVPEVWVVEGLVPAQEGEVGEDDLGRRLLSVYRKLGAQCDRHETVGMVQVRYMMGGRRRQARLDQP